MNLSQLLSVLNCPFTLPELEVAGLKLDSRKVANGDAFVAVPGHATDGRQFMGAAIAAGATVILAEDIQWDLTEHEQTPVVHIPELAMQLSALASHFFANPSQKIAVYGVTGTNGKTTVSHLLAQLKQFTQPPAAVMGTVGSGLVHALLPEALTTPDAITVQQRLASVCAEGAQSVCMEVSSHALTQGRVEAIQFAGVIATNLSRDHLDYHGSMASYAAAKQRLFTEFDSPLRIFNLDDVEIKTWKQNQDFGFSLSDAWLGNERTLVATALEFAHEGTRFTLHWDGESVRVESALLGRFNVSNLLAACTMMLAEGHSLLSIAEFVPQLRAVPGRMETYRFAHGALAIVDYAHTPDALHHVLSAARKHCTGKLWCVFGCGGDRDRGKRPQMGQVAAQLADRVVVTDDNPRTEPPQQIIDDIISGMPHGIAVEAMPGRSQAVKCALERAGAQDVVVIAGKGHETYQIIGTRSVDYDERAYVQQLAEELAHD
ncbi:MAG: UDP-N-acetylmuramoyl-L-alanyl-D-glutamate--2,6-diaminopimelate ligase MurE [Idiomarinaceae bacterium HL-53]|nr:MAG: UDP-N-acetylmuramoyl-L-alanyl-D-glutamate--2,6-diaminopimelate ligase MurE [Idiomarinaceae bacterium HL-53]CUS47398.1 UDP-N-acetylmuramoylalanyl-D-glutamate--2,6-diaminopimelate ligase [Idiomarinaceae bacterium HL-53]